MLWQAAWKASWGNSWGTSWGYTRAEEFARSGYWRLFYYKLQEDFLNKKKLKEVAEQEKLRPKPVIAINVGRKKKAIQREKPVKSTEVIKKKAVLRSIITTDSVPDYIRNTIWLYSYLASLNFTFPSERSTIVTPAPKRKAMSKAHLLLLLASEV